jgi:Fe-S-cluster containining protein
MNGLEHFEDYEIEGLPRTEANLKWLWEHFECTRCGECCRIHKTGTRITLAEADRLATVGGISLQEFLKTVQTTEETYIMPQPCRYLTDSVCTVQDVKPDVCRQYPMHFRKVKDQQTSWVIITACPGGLNLLEKLISGRQEGLEYR